MIEQAIIHAKYSELNEHYADQHIDDYDVFVRSRVVEYFLNNSKEAADNIVDLVERALARNDTCISPDATQDENPDYCSSSNLSSENIATADKVKNDK